jgi:sialidase-1
MHWEDDLLLTIHCQREGEDIGLYVRLVDFSQDKWRTIKEANIWANAPAMKVAAYATMGCNLRFGQPSLLRLDDGDILATHWAIEEGQGMILTHRLRIHP